MNESIDYSAINFPHILLLYKLRYARRLETINEAATHMDHANQSSKMECMVVLSCVFLLEFQKVQPTTCCAPLSSSSLVPNFSFKYDTCSSFNLTHISFRLK